MHVGHASGICILAVALCIGQPVPAPPQTSSHTVERENKEVVRKYIDGLWNELRYELIDQVLAGDLVSHAPDGTVERGSQRFHEVIPAIRKAFPDLHLAIDEILAEGDRVAVRIRITGTHEGEFAGIAATHRRVSAPEWFFFRVSGGRIVESWYLRDQEGLLRQLRATK